MTQSELKEKIEKLDKAIKSPTTPASFLPNLKSKKEGFENDLKNLSKSEAPKPAAEKPAAPKPAASKPAASKPAASKPAASKPAAEKPAASKSAKSISKTAAEKCRELLNQDKARKKSEEKRVTSRKKQGKPAKLTPSEVVNKTAKVVQSKVVTMDMSKREIEKLSAGFVIAIKNAIKGIMNDNQKHLFIKSIITDLNNIDRNFKKTAEYGGYMADGGETEVEQEQMVTRGFFEDEPYEYARGGVASKFEVGDKVMVDDSGYVKSFHGIDLSKPATIISKNKVKFGGKTYFTYGIETADGRKPYNTAVESKLMPVGMAHGGMIEDKYIMYGTSEEGWFAKDRETGRMIHPTEFGRNSWETKEELVSDLKSKHMAHGGMMAKGGHTKDYSGNYYSTNDFVGTNKLEKEADSLFGKDWEAEDDANQILELANYLGGGYKVIVADDRDDWQNLRYKHDVNHTTNDSNYDIFVFHGGKKRKMEDGGMMAKGGMSQGYDDREDERLGMKYGRIGSKDLNSTKARRDDARFEERTMIDGKEFRVITKDRFNKDGINEPYLTYEPIEKKSDGGYMAKGGRPLSAINRDRAYQSQDELWEQNYKRKTRPKHPKYNR
jgi:hypothetical protein